MKDAFGQTLGIGDTVVYAVLSGILHKAVVKGLNLNLQFVYLAQGPSTTGSRVAIIEKAPKL